GGDELRGRLARAEQRILALKRDLDRRRPPDEHSEAALPGRVTGAANAPAADASGAFAKNVDSLTYVGFEDRFRGSQDAIRGRLDDYLPIFAAASDVFDVG